MNALTFDLDWAPDCAIEYVRRKLRNGQVPAAFFVTHQTDILADLLADDHDLGLHPNFAPGSTQGSSTGDIIGRLLKIVPDAAMMRTHGLVQSSRLLAEIAAAFPQICLDLSLFQYRARHCEQTKFVYSADRPPLERLAYNWEDDIAMLDRAVPMHQFTPWGEDHVFDFHPIHIYLNSSGPDEYVRLKSYLGTRALTSATAAELAPFRNAGWGVDTYFDALLSSSLFFSRISAVRNELVAR